MLKQEHSEESRFGRGLAVLVLLGLVGALLFPGLAPIEGRWPNALWNLMHVPTFFVLTWAIFLLWSGPSRRVVRGFAAVASSLLVALGTEWAQQLLERSGNWKDFAFNGVGIGLALFWMLIRDRFRGSWAVFSVVAGIALFACLWPAWGESWAERRQLQRLPELGTFARWETERLWQPQGNAAVWVEDGELHVRIQQGKYGGVSFWPGGQDWTSYSHLSIEMDNPGEAFELGIRIDDERSRDSDGEWFSTSILVDHGERSIEIDLPSTLDGDRVIDFSEVTRLALFTGEEQEGRKFVLKSAFLR